MVSLVLLIGAFAPVARAATAPSFVVPSIALTVGVLPQEIAVGDFVLRVHTHPFLSMNPGDKVYLHLDPQSCNGLPAEDTEGMDEAALGA